MPATAARSTSPSVGPDDTGFIASRDGTALYVEWFDAATDAAPGLAIVLHGYAEHCGRYHEVARVLADLGMPTLTFDFRGHGKSDGARGHVDHFREYLDDVDAALRELDRRAGDTSLPVLMLGHSNGGLVALRLLADPTREPNRVRAVVLSSPFLGLAAKLPLWKRQLAVVSGRYAPRLSMPNEIQIDDLTHDPDKLAARRADTLCNDNATAGWFTAALRAQRYVYDNAVRIEVPTLWVVAGGDRLADPAATRAVHARLRAPSVYREYPGWHHEVLNEVDRQRVFDEIRAFAKQHFPVKNQ
ncbi:MAG: alpha/beta hydrolase [Deltaproteobacteria bacterium]|nr:MAG: alpha/beta hydrolase [Deltaproteobacteria bacterium]